MVIPGNYKISSLIIGNGDSYTQFAAPKANSAKASEVQKPLNISFKLENADIFDLPVEVAKVLNEDKAEKTNEEIYSELASVIEDDWND